MKRITLTALLMCLFTMIPLIAKEKKVILADEQFSKYIPAIKNSRVALFSNHTGIVGDKIVGMTMNIGTGEPVSDPDLVPFGETAEGQYVVYGPHIVDVLIEKGINVTAIFSPEHGFRGTSDPGEVVKSSVDKETGIPILSLYEKGSHLPSAESMDTFDVLLVDIQDVGLRYYTYYITMHHLMDACAQYGKKIIILDRPNPNGFYVDGPYLDMKYKSGIGWLPIPMVHGMTLGELAKMINGEGWLTDGRKCDLKVIRCKNYRHSTRYNLIVPPSPNLKDMKSIWLYSSTCFFEGTVVTPGRGTSFPFEVYGNPEMKDCDFSFTPRSIPGATNPRYKDQLCNGKDLRGTYSAEIQAEGINMDYVIDAYNNLDIGDAFFGTDNHFELLIGDGNVREMIKAGKTAREIEATWQDDVARFKKQRRPYLLYPE